MLFIFTILVVLLLVTGVAVLAKRRIDQDLLESNRPKNLMDTHLRPLFPADEEEVRNGDADAVPIEAEPVDDDDEERLAKLAELRQTWGANPNKRNAVGLLKIASECASAAVYSDVVRSVVREFHSGRINGLAAADLADLIETHLWLLPAKEKMSGEGFMVKQEISELRSE